MIARNSAADLNERDGPDRLGERLRQAARRPGLLILNIDNIGADPAGSANLHCYGRESKGPVDTGRPFAGGGLVAVGSSPCWATASVSIRIDLTVASLSIMAAELSTRCWRVVFGRMTTVSAEDTRVDHDWPETTSMKRLATCHGGGQAENLDAARR